MKIKVLYHDNCRDGFCSAWVASCSFLPSMGVEYVPVSYGQVPPDVTGCDVYILDFSYPSLTMIEHIVNKAKRVIVLDHHETDLPTLIGRFANLEIVYNPDKSGAMLTWEYFGKKPGLAGIVRNVQAGDLWKWDEVSGSKEVCAGIDLYPYEFTIWDTFDLNTLYHEGKVVLKYKQQKVDLICKQAYRMIIDGIEVPVVNTCNFMSEVLNKLSKDAPFAASWFARPDGKIQWSLRSNPGGADVTEIAKKFGGGGHKSGRTAGFETPGIPMELK